MEDTIGQDAHPVGALIDAGLREDALAGFFIAEGFGPLVEEHELDSSAARDHVPGDVASRLLAIPLREEARGLVVAMADPSDHLATHALEKLIEKRVIPVAARYAHLRSALGLDDELVVPLVRTKALPLSVPTRTAQYAKADIFDELDKRSANPPLIPDNGPASVDLELAEMEAELDRAEARFAEAELSSIAAELSAAEAEARAEAAPHRTPVPPVAEAPPSVAETLDPPLEEFLDRSAILRAEKRPETDTESADAEEQAEPDHPARRERDRQTTPDLAEQDAASVPPPVLDHRSGQQALDPVEDRDSEAPPTQSDDERAHSSRRVFHRMKSSEWKLDPEDASGDQWGDLSDMERSVGPTEFAEKKPMEIRALLTEMRVTDDRDRIVSLACQGAATVARAVVFLAIRRGVLKGWNGTGDGISEDAIRNLWIPANSPSVFRTVVESGERYEGPFGSAAADNLFRAATGNRTDNIVVLPVTVDERVVALLVASGVSHDGIGQERLEIVAQGVGRAFRRLLVDKKK